MADKILKHWIEQTLLTACAWAEARDEGEDAMQAVVNVVLNRVQAGLAPTIKDAVLEPYLFAWTNPDDAHYVQVLQTIGGVWPEEWWAANDIVCDALSGKLEDITQGATRYLDIAHTKKLRKSLGYKTELPKWALAGLREGKVTAEIGRYTFFRLA